MKGRSEGVVIRCLVAETLAFAIDHDRAGQGALPGEQHHAHVVERGLDHRHPPCFAHIAEHRARLHRHLLPVAGIGADADRRFERTAQEGLFERLVMLEPASGQHHVAGRDLASVFEHNPGDRGAFILHQAMPGCFEQEGDIAIKTALEQSADQRMAEAPLVVFCPALCLCRIERIGHGLRERGFADGEIDVRPVIG